MGYCRTLPAHLPRLLRVSLRFTLPILLFWPGEVRAETKENRKPNLLLLYVDNLGYGDLGCYGNKLNKTPNIDRLAAEGQRWTSCYSSGATCVPSRHGSAARVSRAWA